ncbi:MAG TPA: hypothetical protein VH138_12625 [Vicinamibacterales bacterium]|nr:hypothetical protein [Vicinamibacterales bacterium]
MAESPRPADVRLTIPAGAPYPELAGEVAAKLAENAGAQADAARRLAASVQALAMKLGNGTDVTLTLEARDRRLHVTASAGDRREHADFSL